MVEGDGTGINAIDYVELSGSGKKEVVVSWRTIEGVNQLGVYSLDELESNETVPVASQLLMTGYSGYSLLDIDRDTRTELAVIRLDPAGVDSTVEVYGWQNGMLALRRHHGPGLQRRADQLPHRGDPRPLYHQHPDGRRTGH